jgi:tetratricopeptide (TPR) repeat protein
MNVHELIQAGIRHQQAGQAAEAEKIYAGILKEEPEQADALCMLAVLALQRGEIDGAIDLLRRATISRPDFRDAYKNLGALLLKKGRLDEAAAANRRAEMLKPEYLERLNKLSKMVWEKGRKETAIAAYLSEIGYKSLTPREQSESDRAIRNPGSATEQAQVDGISVHAQMCMILAEMERFDEAAAAYAFAAAFAPEAAVTHEAMGKILLQKRDWEAAAESFRRALAVDPKRVSSLNYLGVALKTLGKFEEAAACFDRMAKLRPDLALAYSNLASLGKIDADRPDTQQLLELLAQPRLSIANRIALEFALGKAFDKAGRFDEAFSHFATGNSIDKQQHASEGQIYNPNVVDKEVDAIIEVFTPEFFRERTGWGEPSEIPVFIVGMPRSGTTLVQQIAASHPQVHGAGELRHIFDIANSFGETDLKSDALRLDPEKIKIAAQKHLRELQAMDPKAVRIIDKMPDNLHRLGLISLLFPSARVILCRRDARDTCLSCHFQWFGEGNYFAYDLAHCGHQHLARDRIAEHWRHALPLRMLEVQYEELVADLEGQSRRLIEFLGLPWDPACLEFHRTPASIETSSFWQVRQPLYHSSVGRWKHYEKHLGPLLKALDRGSAGKK